MPLPKSEYLSEVWKDGIFSELAVGHGPNASGRTKPLANATMKEDKVIFCTGGAGSICSAQVRAMVYLGANACIIGRNPEKTKKMAEDIATARKGSKVIGLGEVDVRKLDDLEKAVGTCVKELGSLDFCIAGAAGNFLAPLNQLSSNAFKTVMEIDVLGSYNCLKATLPYLLKSAAANKNDGTSTAGKGTGGRIIFVSATLHYAGTPLQAHAMAAKAAVDALSSAVCIEQGPLGVTSNSIAPGPIANTEGVDRLSHEGGRRDAERGVPAGRFGLVKEIADATVYLFSDAGNYVNGSVLVVDGGAWRTQGGIGGGAFKYPDFLLSGDAVTGVKGGRKDKAKI